MKLTRRTLIQSSAAAMGIMSGTRLWANTSLQMGTKQIDTLSDGHLVLPVGFITDTMPEAELADILNRAGVTGDSFTPDCNVTLMRDGDRVFLFDLGSGSDFMTSAGKLLDALDMAGIDPYDVTDVVFTHAHPDHLWGLLDDFGDLFCPNATYHMGQAEWAYWTDPDTVSSIGSARTAFAVGAARRLAEIKDRVQLFTDGAEILPGLVARETPGHTPGHMSFEIWDGSRGIMVIGDAIGNHHVAFERPHWPSGSDQDQDLGAATRAQLLDQIATDQMTLIGYHLPAPGIGRVDKTTQGYRYIPA